jgi:hypothetical protein
VGVGECRGVEAVVPPDVDVVCAVGVDEIDPEAPAGVPVADVAVALFAVVAPFWEPAVEAV